MWYFYVLQSQKNLNYFYKGSTGNLAKRLQEHDEGLTYSLRPYRPLRLVYYEAYLTEKAARLREQSVKHNGGTYIALLKRLKLYLDAINN